VHVVTSTMDCTGSHTWWVEVTHTGTTSERLPVIQRGLSCARGPPWGRRRRRGTRHPTMGGNASGGGGRRGGDAGAGTMGPSRCPARATGGAYLTRRATARGPRGGPGWRAREGPGAPESARQATADRAPRGGCSALRVGRLLSFVCNDRLGGLDTHGGNYLHWLVTAVELVMFSTPGQSHRSCGVVGF